MAQRSTAVYIGMGCAAFLALMIVIGGACVFWLYNEGKRIESEMSDPDVRGERVLEILGTDRLPDSYYSLAAFSIPFLMETAVLTDRPPDEDGVADEGFDERGFIYVKMIRVGQDEEELRDYFEGRTDDVDVLQDNGINIDVDEVIGRGAYDQDDARVMYVAQRGDVGFQNQRGGGITTLAWITCEQDSRVRMAIWFGPDPDPEAAADSVDFTGTPADELMLQEFLGQFDFCR